VACAVGLQVITETAYTNPLFVATTEIAAANGDLVTPSTFLSIQSDEARHMANGYATLSAVLSEPSNIPMLQRDLDRCFWRQHAFLDPFLTVVYDYFCTSRVRSYREYWEEWVWEDWVGAYMDRLAPYGISRPETAEAARGNVPWVGHDLAVVTAAMWPVHFWRQDPMTAADFEYLEDKYPGWWNRYGSFWERYAEVSERSAGGLSVELLEETPLICRVCQMPALAIAGTSLDPRVVADPAGRRHAFCSDDCEDIFVEEPHRYTGRTWSEINDGVELSEYLVREGLVRTDGVTLVPQPHLATEASRLWTVEDIRRYGIEIKDPLRRVPTDRIRQLDSGPVPASAG
jgi:methane monooxygenase component A alpha chain